MTYESNNYPPTVTIDGLDAAARCEGAKEQLVTHEQWRKLDAQIMAYDLMLRGKKHGNTTKSNPKRR